MKPIETILDSKKKHKLVMWLCILYGGFAIFLFALDAYSLVWSGSTFFSTNPQQREFDQNRFTSIDANFGSDFNRERSGPPMFNPLRIITSPSSILILISGLISLSAGFTIWNITREKEIKKIKQETAEYLLLPDEKKVIEVLKYNDYSLPQNKITKESGLTKVQVHRVLKRLETKGLIEKHEYGLTNKIVLKKELIE
ncbi:MAG: hypothetical protein WC462_02440 [archaeon]